MAYDRKNWSMGNLCQCLTEHGASLGIAWGWKIDPKEVRHRWVLYVDLPHGQASFHSERRGIGPDYAGKWDHTGASEDRIIAFCDEVIGAMELANIGESNG